MIKNPIISDPIVRIHHIVLCVLLGIAYSVSIGIPMRFSTLGVIIDSLCSIPLFYMEAVFLWSIFTFERRDIMSFYQTVSIHAVYFLLAVTFMLWAEYAIMFIFNGKDCPYFVTSLPIRVFSLAVIYSSFRRYYVQNKDMDEDEPLETEVDEVKETDVIPSALIERITVKVGNKIKIIPIEEIIFLKAEDDYVNVFTESGHWLKNERLKDYENSLPSEKFARVHRSYIVNLAKITKIERYGQKQLLFMNNGEQIRISPTGYKVLKGRLNL